MRRQLRKLVTPPLGKKAQKGAIDGFLLGMVAAVLLASFWPELGQSEGLLKLGHVTDLAVFALFFLHGMGLSTDSLKAGAGKWRLHALVQLSTFAMFPLWWWLLSKTIGQYVSPELRMGFFYLAVLPSTVSSSVAMTALARGDVASAVLNATLSVLLGVWLTPMWVGLMMAGSGHTIDMSTTMMRVLQMLLLPLVLGYSLRPFLGQVFARIKPWTARFDRVVIVTLVWVAFSDSVADGLWVKHGLGLLLQAFVGAWLFLLPMLWLTRYVSRRMGLPMDDEIVAMFCGSKKSLASGMPMAKLLFAGNPALGVLVLPIMAYHQIQMFVCAILARRYAGRQPSIDPVSET